MANDGHKTALDHLSSLTVPFLLFPINPPLCYQTDGLSVYQYEAVRGTPIKMIHSENQKLNNKEITPFFGLKPTYPRLPTIQPPEFQQLNREEWNLLQNVVPGPIDVRVIKINQYDFSPLALLPHLTTIPAHHGGTILIIDPCDVEGLEPLYRMIRETWSMKEQGCLFTLTNVPIHIIIPNGADIDNRIITDGEIREILINGGFDGTKVHFHPITVNDEGNIARAENSRSGSMISISMDLSYPDDGRLLMEEGDFREFNQRFWTNHIFPHLFHLHHTNSLVHLDPAHYTNPNMGQLGQKQFGISGKCKGIPALIPNHIWPINYYIRSMSSNAWHSPTAQQWTGYQDGYNFYLKGVEALEESIQLGNLLKLSDNQIENMKTPWAGLSNDLVFKAMLRGYINYLNRCEEGDKVWKGKGQKGMGQIGHNGQFHSTLNPTSSNTSPNHKEFEGESLHEFGMMNQHGNGHHQSMNQIPSIPPSTPSPTTPTIPPAPNPTIINPSQITTGPQYKTIFPLIQADESKQVMFYTILLSNFGSKALKTALIFTLFFSNDDEFEHLLRGNLDTMLDMIGEMAVGQNGRGKGGGDVAGLVDRWLSDRMNNNNNQHKSSQPSPLPLSIPSIAALFGGKGEDDVPLEPEPFHLGAARVGGSLSSSATTPSSILSIHALPITTPTPTPSTPHHKPITDIFLPVLYYVIHSQYPSTMDSNNHHHFGSGYGMGSHFDPNHHFNKAINSFYYPLPPSSSHQTTTNPTPSHPWQLPTPVPQQPLSTVASGAVIAGLKWSFHALQSTRSNFHYLTRTINTTILTPTINTMAVAASVVNARFWEYMGYTNPNETLRLGWDPQSSPQSSQQSKSSSKLSKPSSSKKHQQSTHNNGIGDNQSSSDSENDRRIDPLYLTYDPRQGGRESGDGDDEDGDDNSNNNHQGYTTEASIRPKFNPFLPINPRNSPIQGLVLSGNGIGGGANDDGNGDYSTSHNNGQNDQSNQPTPPQPLIFETHDDGLDMHYDDEDYYGDDEDYYDGDGDGDEDEDDDGDDDLMNQIQSQFAVSNPNLGPLDPTHPGFGQSTTTKMGPNGNSDDNDATLHIQATRYKRRFKSVLTIVEDDLTFDPADRYDVRPIGGFGNGNEKGGEDVVPVPKKASEPLFPPETPKN